MRICGHWCKELSVQNPADDSAGYISASTCSRSIFGTAISQTRNKFDPDNFNHCVLIVTASAVYFTIKIRGMAGA
jgi:hypothetical protein